MYDERGPLTDDMRRVLRAASAFVPFHDPTAVVPLRKVATAILGDEQKAAAVLASLDAAGYVRTDTMGWHSGWVTAKGLLEARTSKPDAKSQPSS